MVRIRDARNTVEKQGDLEAHSFVRAEIVASYLDNGPRVQVPAKLWDGPLQLVKSIPAGAVGDHIRKDGIVRIQRRWIESTLPDYELVEAVAVAYGRLSTLVDDAHHQLGLQASAAAPREPGNDCPNDERDGRLPCMNGHADARTLDVLLAPDALLEFEVVKPKIDLRDGSELITRYAVRPTEIFGESDVAEDRLRSLFATARKMFEKDGHHITVAFLLRDGKPVEIRELRPAQHGHKYLMMRELAHEVVRLGADAVMLLGDDVVARADPSKPMMRAVELPDRVELLTGTVVTKAGEPLELSAEINRNHKVVTLGATCERRGGAEFAFVPVYKAWGRPLPVEWTSGAVSDGARQQ